MRAINVDVIEPKRDPVRKRPQLLRHAHPPLRKIGFAKRSPFDGGKLPKSGHASGGGGSLPQQKPIFLFAHDNGRDDPFRLARPVPQGPDSLRSGGSSAAPSVDRADLAMRTARETYERAQFHHRLVPSPRAARIGGFDEQAGRFRQFPARRRPLDVAFPVQYARQHSHDISVHGGAAAAERNGRDSGRRIISETGQRPQFVILRGEAAVLFDGDSPRGGSHLPRAPVITQPAPRFEQALLRGGGQAFQSREAIEKSLVIRDNGSYARLLQHHFGKPDAVGVFRAPPRQVALVAVIPGKQGFDERRADCGAERQAPT